MTVSASRAGARREAGFTLVEALAAMLIVAIVIPVLVEGAMLANRVGVVAERERKAARLADAVLTEAVVTEAWLDGDQSGDFSPSDPGFSWELTSEAWEEDTMELVTVEVSFEVQGETYSTWLSTLVPESTS